MISKKRAVLQLILLTIITVPAFLSLLNTQYFSMHDDQHITRLFLLHEGLKQGYWYPRWVDQLGFGYGYPLYNFYPPLIYYIAEVFHLMGFSLVDSIRLLIIFGFLLGSLSIFFLVKKLADSKAALVASTLYTYFFYHLVTVYVRGALAEFFSLAIIPVVILSVHNLYKKNATRNSVWFGIALSLLILCHPLIAVPFLIFLAIFFISYLLRTKQKIEFVRFFATGLTIGLTLSAFFWLPSMLERKFTLVDNILLKELANYRIHFVYPQQFFYSLWGYGGSIEGPYDGLTFQLGKIHLSLALIGLLIGFVSSRKLGLYVRLYTSLTIFSIFMTTQYSSLIWNNIKYLWYLQFPWRFLTFTAVFISVTGALVFSFMEQRVEKISKNLSYFVTAITIVAVIGIYSKYAHPQRFYNKTEVELTSYEEIAWRVSRTSFEFAPKGVKTKKTDLGTTTIAIEKKELPKNLYEIVEGKAVVIVVKNRFGEKVFQVTAETPILFRLNTFYFPGWKAYVDGKETRISDINNYKLMTIAIPPGSHNLAFRFANTPIRTFANGLSGFSLFLVIYFFVKKSRDQDYALDRNH